MIYLDTSVALAQLLSEDRMPPMELWREPLVSSRLLEYELWTRIHGRSLAKSHGELARQFLRGISFVELHPIVLSRALEPFPMPVRTLDSLHLASIEFLRAQGQPLLLATFDERMASAARKLRIPLYPW